MFVHFKLIPRQTEEKENDKKILRLDPMSYIIFRYSDDCLGQVEAFFSFFFLITKEEKIKNLIRQKKK